MSPTSSSCLESLVSDWLRWAETGSPDREVVADLRNRGDWHQLERIMADRVAFGTAGIRARMGPG